MLFCILEAIYHKLLKNTEGYSSRRKREWENGKSEYISLHTTITFLSPLGIPPFSHFYLQSQPRRLQMWRNVTQCDRWVRLRLLLPVCPRFCHTYFFLHSEGKTMSSRAAGLHPKAPASKKILDSYMIRKFFLVQ